MEEEKPGVNPKLRPSATSSVFPVFVLDFVFIYVLPCVVFIPFVLNELFSKRNFKKITSQVKKVVGGGETSKIAMRKNSAVFLAPSHAHKHLELYSAPGATRQLAFVYPWLTAKPRHVRKFIQMLLDVNTDVLVVWTYPFDPVNPVTGSQGIADEVVDFIRERSHRYDKYAVFACSIGAYVFSETVLKFRACPSLRSEVYGRFVAQVYDSPVDVRSAGESAAVLVTGNKQVQRWINKCVRWFLSVRYHQVTKHYQKAAEAFYNVLLPCPNLYIYSDRDPMSPAAIHEDIAERWQRHGLQMNTLVFGEGSGHCMNFASQPNRYRRAFLTFLASTTFADPQRVRQILDGENSSLLEEKSLLLYEKSSRGRETLEDDKSSRVQETLDDVESSCVKEIFRDSHVDRIPDDTVAASR